MTVHIFGAKDSPCCAEYALLRTANDHETEFSRDCINSIRRNFYADDLMKSCKSSQDAIKLAAELISILELGGFKLTKFTSNRREVMDSVPVDLRAAPKPSLEMQCSQVERALGVKLNLEEDCFVFSSINKDVDSTKRGILQDTSSVLDPLGFVSPFILQAKLLLQELWRR